MPGRDEAIAAAKQLEVDGRRFYLDAAKKASTPVMKKTFESLAADEEKHLEWLEELAPGVAASKDANRALYATLRGIFAEAAPSVRRAAAKTARKPAGDLAAIDLAIAMEEKSVAAYSAWARSGESADIRKLGEVLVGIERFHGQVLANAKEYLSNPGDWFAHEERWNFEGG